MAATSAQPCTDEQISQLTAPSTTPYVLRCQARLEPSQAITRPVVFLDAASSRASLDCQGGSVGTRNAAVSAASPTIAIWSSKQADGRWSAPRDVSIRNCTIYGAIRIWGIGAGGQYDDLRQSSRTPDHTQHLQQAAPRAIGLENLTIVANGTIPLYIGPGVTRVTLRDSTLSGRSDATAIYLDAESAHIRIRNNRILTRTSREQIAVDGSAHNTISGNRFDLHGKAGISLYRNCGERGVIRHQTPSFNVIEGNRFTGASWIRPRLVVENARNGRRSYCGDDAGYPFGSSADDRDNATGNTIRNNSR